MQRSGTLGLHNMVYRVEMGLEFRYARSIDSRRNGVQQDIYLSCSGYDMKFANWQDGCVVGPVKVVGEDP